MAFETSVPRKQTGWWDVLSQTSQGQV